MADDRNSDRERTTSLNKPNDADVPVLNDAAVNAEIQRSGTNRIVSVLATCKDQRHQKTITFEERVVLGEGSFGRVYMAVLQDSGDTVAVKTVLQDHRYKNRELHVIRELCHPNIVNLKYYFFTKTDHERVAQNGNVFLSLVMEYLPENLYAFTQRYAKRSEQVPVVELKSCMFQVFRGLAYLHANSICHRDIKPQNILVNPQTCVVKVCDLGSAKTLEAGKPSVAYICSRYFRAPELLMGAEHYNVAIDCWAAGCTMAEMFLQRPLWPGSNTQDQLAKIIRTIGSPSHAQLKEISIECRKPDILMQSFPLAPSKKWIKVLPDQTPPEAINLLSKLLDYVPKKRISMMQALAHPFFDELRDPTLALPSGQPLPPLFNFTTSEHNQAEQLKVKIFSSPYYPVAEAAC